MTVNRKLNEDIYIAIRDAFLAMQRQLEDYARKRREKLSFMKLAFMDRSRNYF